MSASLFPTGVPIGKRVLDLLLAVPGFVLVSPILGLLWLAVRISLGTPVVFRQVRPGLRSEPFTLYKFRTMTEAAGEDGRPLPDDERLTRLGRFLRSSSLDELPELLNVLRGEMSLVGPRPLLMEYVERYTPTQARRHDVLPGMTGWAQVNGRNAITWEAKFELDVWYVDHWSLALDVRILVITMAKWMTGEGVSPPGQATADEFRGTPGRPREEP